MAVTAWTKHLTSTEDRDNYVKSLYRAKWLLDDIKKLLNSSEESLEAQEISPKSYDNVNWAYRQAHSNGYKQCLRDFNKLLTLDPQDPKEHG